MLETWAMLIFFAANVPTYHVEGAGFVDSSLVASGQKQYSSQKACEADIKARLKEKTTSDAQTHPLGAVCVRGFVVNPKS